MTIALLILVAGLAAVIVYQRKISLDQIGHYDTLLSHRDAEIERVQAEKVALFDRFYVQARLPPSTVNLGEQYEARTAEAVANRDRTKPMVLASREAQLRESFERKAEEIRAQTNNAANGNS